MATGLEQKNAAMKSLLTQARALDATISYLKIGDWATKSTWKFYTSANVEVTSTPLTDMKTAFVLADTPVAVVTDDKIEQLGVGRTMIKGDMSFSASAGALTIAIKPGGNNPSPTNPVQLDFEDRQISWPTTLQIVIPSGATLGGASGFSARFWLVVFDNAGTPVLGVIKCAVADQMAQIRCLRPDNETIDVDVGGGPYEFPHSTIATSSDIGRTFYVASTFTARKYKILGYFEYNPIVTAGTWVTPGNIVTYKLGVPLPGSIIQSEGRFVNSFTDGTTIIPIDNSIPQKTEGTQFLSNTMRLVSGANVVRIEADVMLYSPQLAAVTVAIFRGTESDAFISTVEQIPNDYRRMQVSCERIFPSYVSSTGIELYLRAGMHIAGTLTFNGIASANYLGGTMISWLRITEIQG